MRPSRQRRRGLLRKGNRARRRKERGSTVVESALILPLFLSLFIGIVDFGQILFLHQTLVERVRNAVRTAVVSNGDEAAIKNLVVYQQTTNPGTGPGFYGLTTENVQVVFADQGSPEQRLTVTVSGLVYPVYTPLIATTLRNMPIRITTPLETP